MDWTRVFVYRDFGYAPFSGLVCIAFFVTFFFFLAEIYIFLEAVRAATRDLSKA